MKKNFALFLSLLLSLCLTACADDSAIVDAQWLPDGSAVSSSLPDDDRMSSVSSLSDDGAASSAPILSDGGGTSSTPPPSDDGAASSVPALSDGGGTSSTPPPSDDSTASDQEALLPEDGSYTTKEDVALYIHQYGHLPDNFMTKRDAEALGWSGGSLEPYAPGMCIGGSHFGNYEGLLPEADGRTYTECDIDTLGAKSRGAKRIVFSNDGLVYYTGDHYESFELLYGEEDP